MAFHLKYSGTTGHLLYSSNGHLVNECSALASLRGLFPRVVEGQVNSQPALFYFSDDVGGYNKVFSFARYNGTSAWVSAPLGETQGPNNTFGHQLKLSIDSTSSYPDYPAGGFINTSNTGGVRGTRFAISTDTDGSSFNRQTIEGFVTNDDSCVYAILLDSGLVGLAFQNYSTGKFEWWLSDDIDCTGFTYSCDIGVSTNYNTSNDYYPVHLKMVDGRPAILWQRISAQQVVYLRADDADGTGWTGTIATKNCYGAFPSVDFIDFGGYPAVVYQSQTSPYGVCISIGTDADASSWGSEVDIANDSGVPTSDLYYGIYDTLDAVGINFDGTNLNVRWSTRGFEYVYSPTPVPTSFSYTSYYPLIAYKKVIYGSTSTTGAASSWTSYTEEWSFQWTLAEITGASLNPYDADLPNWWRVPWINIDSNDNWCHNGIDTAQITPVNDISYMYYNGNMVYE